jgi:uncharacterized protein with ATP-grasp and redox domains
MKAYVDCYPCFLRQALEAARMATNDEDVHRRVLQHVATLMAEFSPEATPMEMGEEIHRAVREMAASPGPYREVKRESNDLALALYPELRKMVRASPDPLLTAVKIAAAGNVADFGASPGFDLEKSVREALAHELADSDFPLFRSRLPEARRILYVGDNAGEIVFDKILVEEMVGRGAEVTFVVRGGPVLNDATLEDARYVGMDEFAQVISSGALSPGTLLRDGDPAFLNRFNGADLVLAKGQGNYEGLSDEPGPLFFLLTVKCSVVAHHLGARIGQRLLLAQRDPGRVGTLLPEERS